MASSRIVKKMREEPWGWERKKRGSSMHDETRAMPGGKNVKRDLSILNLETVNRFLTDLAEKDTRIRERVEALFLSSDAAMLSESLKARLDSFHALPEALGFRDLFPLARDFRAFLSDTEILMAPLDAGVALDLVDRFLDLDRILDGLEEGGGPLQAVFSEACDLWLDLAAKSGLAMPWGEKILAHFLKDRFGVRANLMRHGDRLLSQEKLALLADRMLADAEEKALDAGGEWRRYRLAMGLRYLSQALRDPELMAQSVTLVQTEPSPRQIGDIVQAYLDYEGPEAALAWLTGDWGERELERLDLLDQVYGAMDDREMLFQIRRERYAAQPSAEYLLALLDVCDPEEREAFLATAPETARHTTSLYSGLNLLLSVGAVTDAETLLVERQADLTAYDHTAVLRIQEKFEAAHSTLGQILCYRTLVEGILEEARFRAYVKAVGYCGILARLDERFKNYGLIPDHAAYLASLRMRYGDKRVFWQKLEGQEDWEGALNTQRENDDTSDQEEPDLDPLEMEEFTGSSSARNEDFWQGEGRGLRLDKKAGRENLSSHGAPRKSGRSASEDKPLAKVPRGVSAGEERRNVPRETWDGDGGRKVPRGTPEESPEDRAQGPSVPASLRKSPRRTPDEGGGRKVPRGTPGGILG